MPLFYSLLIWTTFRWWKGKPKNHVNNLPPVLVVVVVGSFVVIIVVFCSAVNVSAILETFVDISMVIVLGAVTVVITTA